MKLLPFRLQWFKTRRKYRAVCEGCGLIIDFRFWSNHIETMHHPEQKFAGMDFRS